MLRHRVRYPTPPNDASFRRSCACLCMWSDQLLVDPAGYLISHATKNSQLLFTGALSSSGVIEAPVHELVRSREDRAAFSGVVADRDNVGDVLSQEAHDILRFLMRNINAD